MAAARHGGDYSSILTPSQTQKALADESGPNLSCYCHVGLPGLCEDPAERCEEEEVQEGCCHDAHALMTEKKEAWNKIFSISIKLSFTLINLTEIEF